MGEITEIASTTTSKPATAAAEPPTSTGGLFARLLAFARRHKEFKRFTKFAIVGAIGFIIDAGTVNGLLRLGVFNGATVPLPFDIATITEVGIVGALGFIFAVSSNFVWNRYWTYPDSRSKRIGGQLVTFFFVNLMGLLIRIPILEGLSGPFGRLVEAAAPALRPDTAAWLGINAALVLAVIVVMFWNFFVNRYWTYNDVE